jgi:hypothetical protein
MFPQPARCPVLSRRPTAYTFDYRGIDHPIDSIMPSPEYFGDIGEKPMF